MSEVEWRALVIGSGANHDANESLAGVYRFWRLKRRVEGGALVTAEVVPDMNTRQGEDGPHLWGVSWPARKAVWKRNAKGEMAEVKPFQPAKKIGGKAGSLAAAKAAAEQAIRTGQAASDEPPEDA